jgi:hypothetical protein
MFVRKLVTLPRISNHSAPELAPVPAEPSRARVFALGTLAVCVLLTFPACKKKEAVPSNEQSAAVPSYPPAAPANAPPAAAPDNGAQPPQAPAQTEPAPAPQPLVVTAGTPLTVRLTDELGSKISQPGQTFSAMVDKDVMVDGQTAIPANSSVTGTVRCERLPKSPLPAIFPGRFPQASTLVASQ